MAEQSIDSSNPLDRLIVPYGHDTQTKGASGELKVNTTETFEVPTQIEFVDLSNWKKFSHGHEAIVYLNEDGTRVTKIFNQPYHPRHFERFQIMLAELKEKLEQQGITDTTSYPEIKVVLTQNGFGLQMDFIQGQSIGKLTDAAFEYPEECSKEEIQVAHILNRRAAKLIEDACDVTKKHFGFASPDIGSVSIWNDDLYILNILVVGEPPTTTQEAKEAKLIYFDPIPMRPVAAVVDRAEGIGKVKAALSECPKNSVTENIQSFLERTSEIPWHLICNEENMSLEEVINFISRNILIEMSSKASIQGFYCPNPDRFENPSQTPSFSQKAMTALGFRDKSLATVNLAKDDFSISFKVPWNIVLDELGRTRSVYSLIAELEPLLSRTILGDQ